MVKHSGWLSGSISVFSLVLLMAAFSRATADGESIEEDQARARRSTTGEESLLLPSQGNVGPRDKKVPKGFLGLRGKKAGGVPSGFLGLRGRRFHWDDKEQPEGVNPGEGGPISPNGGEDVFSDMDKRAQSNYYSLRGKKLPTGFMGLRGKKIPSGFMGLRGKKAPSYFLGLRGKKAEEIPSYDDLEDLLKAMQFRYRNNYLKSEEEKRAPKGFLGLRGKKNEENRGVSDYDNLNDDMYGNLPEGFSPLYDRPTSSNFDKRVPRGFLGLRG